MTRVVIHIGTEKTGTTSLQHFFHQHRASLLAHNVVYPHIGQRADAHFDLVNEIHPLDHNGRFMEFLPQPNQPIGHLWGKLKTCIEQHEGKTLLLSAEHFSSRCRQQGLAYMADFFRTLNIEPEILVFLRPQDEFIESSYSTEIKAGGVKPFANSLAHYSSQPFRYDYAVLLDLWAQHFGQQALHVVPYQSHVVADVCQYTLSYLGLSEEVIRSEYSAPSGSTRLNSKWGRDMLELARIVNIHHKHLSPVEKKAFLDRCAERLPAQANETLMTSAERQAVRDHFASSNQQVAERYLQRPTLFDWPSIVEQAPLAPPLPKHKLISLLLD